ncbi:MAG: hypothetical protein KJN67_05055 [Pontiella sp.]|nr:hypothetical protein [Pontiella sp.]
MKSEDLKICIITTLEEKAKDAIEELTIAEDNAEIGKALDNIEDYSQAIAQFLTTDLGKV